MITLNYPSLDKQIYSGTSTGRSDIVMDIFLMKISYICLFSYIAFFPTQLQHQNPGSGSLGRRRKFPSMTTLLSLYQDLENFHLVS